MAGLTKEQIFNAANELFNEGISPTLVNVRKKLGTGSMSTITAVMAEWRNEQKKPEMPIREITPPEIMERMDFLGSEVWAVALAMANTRLKAEREALEAARYEMDLQVKETVEVADQISNENEILKQKLAEFEQKYLAITDSLRLESEKVISLQSKAESDEKHITSLKDEQQAIKNQIAKEREEITRLNTLNSKLLAELEGVRSNLKHSQDATDSIRIEKDQVLKERDVACTEIINIRIESARLEGEVSSLQGQIKNLETRNVELSKQLRASDNQCAKLEAMLETSKKQQPKKDTDK